MVPEPRSLYALRFFLVSVLLLTCAAVLSAGLLILIPVDANRPSNRFSGAFVMTTFLLLAGSHFLHRAVAMVRLERQRLFRLCLLRALCAGTLFVAVQVYALASLIQHQHPADSSAPGAAFVVVMAALHGMHFVIALLFLTYVTVQAFADRYDHEYFFGVTVCSRFWHLLAVVWCAILVVMMIVRYYAS